MKTIHLRTLLPMAALLMPIFASGKTNISVQFRTSGGFHSHDRSSSYSYHQISRPSCPPPRATCPPPRPACPPNQSFRGHPRQQGPVIHHHHYQGLGSRYIIAMLQPTCLATDMAMAITRDNRTFAAHSVQSSTFRGNPQYTQLRQSIRPIHSIGRILF